MELKNKTIVIVSQQDWGEMFISKNHYAVELGRMGNKVFYLPGPEKRRGLKSGEIRVEKLKYEGVYFVDHCLFFPDQLKFKARKLFDRLIKYHVKRLLQQIGHVDIVWSFDLSNTIPLNAFPSSCTKIYMPVDELDETMAVKAANTADIIFSITNEILSKFDKISVPKIFLNHGVSEKFINEIPGEAPGHVINVGLSGNFLRPDIDRKTLLQIIKENQDVHFNIWGSVGKTKSNITAVIQNDTIDFVAELEQCKNVILHGPVDPDQLAEAFKAMDCFLICYDIDKDQSKGTNYHKILEYLATGKVVVSNNVTTYTRFPGILQMTTDRTNNKELPVLMKQVLGDLKNYNSLQKQMQRVAFAKQFTYPNQLKKIEAELNKLSA